MKTNVFGITRSFVSMNAGAAADCVRAQGAEFLSNEEIGCIIINEPRTPAKCEDAIILAVHSCLTAKLLFV